LRKYAIVFIPEARTSKVETAIENLKRYKLADTDRIPAVLIHAGGTKLRPETHNLINSVWNMEELSRQRKESITASV
jgi:hypothetical protein